ncbi:right-handed parallel beta-helix repeat-containing protein [Cryptosporangium phraense]|uniref:right-handed parallel beta-helix repeat-containing protein n=1 Tax=Cryptosporangium phraense TaxID=2593070 RepID=UPI00197AE029|nr:right-handed parallel beta-helix repeat-containing protein [Cryptosporangium phraense]
MKRLPLILGAVLLVCVVVVAGLVIANQSDDSGPRTGDAVTDRGNENTLTVGPHGQYRTIQAAVDAAEAGDTVRIEGGTYHEAVDVTKSGRAGAYLTIAAKDGEKVVLDGEGTLPDTSGEDRRGLLTFDKQQYVKISGISVTRSKRHGIYAGHSSHVVIDDAEVSYSQDGGILLGDGTDYTLTGNRVHHNNAAADGGDIGAAANEGLTLYRARNFRIAGNVVHENYEEGIDVKNSTSDGTIEYNSVYANNGPNIYVDGANDIQVFSNDVYDAKGPTKSGIGLAVESGGSARNVQIFNNLLHGNPGGGVDFWIGAYSDVQIYNNTIYQNGRAAIRLQSGTVSNSVAVNNIIWGNPLIDVPGVTMSGNLTSDPEFVDLNAGDVRLKESSPAIDAANPARAPKFDFTGAARPVGGAPDLGAYEYGAKPPSPSPSAD